MEVVMFLAGLKTSAAVLHLLALSIAWIVCYTLVASVKKTFVSWAFCIERIDLARF
jgi:hypothetical protein